MTRFIPRAKASLCALAAVLLLAGCGSGPPQAGSAAIVGERAIRVSAVQNELDWLLDNVSQVSKAQESGKLATVSRRIVRARVLHELVGVAANRAGLKPDSSQVTKLIDSAGGTAAAAKAVGVAPQRLREVASDQVLLEQLGKYYLDKLSVSFVGTMITSESPAATAEEKALDLANRVAAHPRRASELVRGTGQAVRRSDLGLREVVSQSPSLAASAVFGARAGTVVVIKPSREQSGWLVAKVTERKVDEGGGGESQQPANPRLLYQVGVRMLQPIASERGVRINPRYGVWDPTSMSVAPSAEEVAGHQLRSRSLQP